MASLPNGERRNKVLAPFIATSEVLDILVILAFYSRVIQLNT